MEITDKVPKTQRLLEFTSRASKSILSRLVSFEEVVCAYWTLFWFGNSIDKFVNRLDLPLLTLYGIDRSDQLSAYFEAGGRLPAELVQFAFWAIGFWEIFLALLFTAGGIYFLKSEDEEHDRRNLITLALLMNGITFTIFSLFDILVGDRSELTKHGTFFGVTIASWLAVLHRRYWMTP